MYKQVELKTEEEQAQWRTSLQIALKEPGLDDDFKYKLRKYLPWIDDD